MNNLPEDCQRLIWKYVFDTCIEEMNNTYRLKHKKQWLDLSCSDDEWISWAIQRINSPSFMRMSKAKPKRMVHYYDGVF